MPNEVVEFNHRHTFKLTHKQYLEEPLDKIAEMSYILNQMNEKERLENKHG